MDIKNIIEDYIYNFIECYYSNYEITFELSELNGTFLLFITYKNLSMAKNFNMNDILDYELDKACNFLISEHIRRKEL